MLVHGGEGEQGKIKEMIQCQKRFVFLKAESLEAVMHTIFRNLLPNLLHVPHCLCSLNLIYLSVISRIDRVWYVCLTSTRSLLEIGATTRCGSSNRRGGSPI